RTWTRWCSRRSCRFRWPRRTCSGPRRSCSRSGSSSCGKSRRCCSRWRTPSGKHASRLHERPTCARSCACTPASTRSSRGPSPRATRSSAPSRRTWTRCLRRSRNWRRRPCSGKRAGKAATLPSSTSVQRNKSGTKTWWQLSSGSSPWRSCAVPCSSRGTNSARRSRGETHPPQVTSRL
ncbi:unnamed protein product, partial [Ixodes persulcatus]